MKLYALLLLALFLVFSHPAYAYFDPGAGSILLQAILAVVFVSASTIGIFWNRIKSFIKAILFIKKDEESK